MANREALRDLQSRLAGRLQAARSECVSVAAWLAVQAGEQDYLLPLNQAGEIFPWTGVQPVPYTQPWYLGIANLRGSLMGVVDLAQLLGQERSRNEQDLLDCSLLAFSPALEINTALLVDRLLGLRAAQAFVQTEAAPEHSPHFFGAVHIDATGRRWQELQLQRLSQTAKFLSIRA